MAVLESPILIELRSDLESLNQLDESVRDQHPETLSICKTLESAFRHGLLRDSMRENTDYFDIVLSLFEQQNALGRPRGCKNALPISICKAISFVCGVKCLYSSKGRGRLLLRCALNGQWISAMIEALRQWSDINGYYMDDALIRKNAAFLQLLHQMEERYKFRLDLENFAFLDTTWERPLYLAHQLVPCKDLGLMVCAVEGHIIVTKVKPYSVAGEDEKVETGDFLISIDNVILFDLSPDFIAKMIKRLGGRVPINISVAKARGSKNKVFPSILPYLKFTGIDPDQLEQKWNKMSKWKLGRAYSCPTNDLLSELKISDDSDDSDEVFQSANQEMATRKDLIMARSGFQLTYLGSLQVMSFLFL